MERNRTLVKIQVPHEIMDHRSLRTDNISPTEYLYIFSACFLYGDKMLLSKCFGKAIEIDRENCLIGAEKDKLLAINMIEYVNSSLIIQCLS